MGKIALFIPKYFEMWLTDPLMAFLLTSAMFGFVLLLKIVFWLLLDYKYWKMEKELKKRYGNKI